MKELVTSPQGILSYYDLCILKYGGTSLDSLIEHNIIHLRPSAQCHFDINVEMSSNDGLIMAETPCGFNAMKAWVTRYELSGY